MTQAFNLSQLANNLNTSGQLDATDGLSGTIPDSNLANSGVTAGTYTVSTVTVDAKGRVTSASSGTAGGIGGMALYTSSGTWTVPAGITKVYVSVFGGGGGGANLWANSGGSGGFVQAFVTVTPGSVIAVTVGGGGAGLNGGSAGGTAGSGGTSSFGSFASATGGTGAYSSGGGGGTNGTLGTYSTTGTIIRKAAAYINGGGDPGAVGTGSGYLGGGGGGGMGGGGGGGGDSGGSGGAASGPGFNGSNGSNRAGGAGGGANGGAGGSSGSYAGGGGGGGGGVIIQW